MKVGNHMLRNKFKSTEQMLNFILNTQEFLQWTIIECHYEITDIYNVTVNTDIYKNLNSILSQLNAFNNVIKNKNYKTLKFQLKLEPPVELKNVIDVEDEYYNLIIYSYSDDDTIIMGTNHYEKSRNSGLVPIKNWDIYYSQLYQTWYNSLYNQLN